MNHRIATLLAIALLLVSSPAFAQDNTSAVPNPTRVAELIAQLSHEQYSVREEATNQLTQLGVAVVPELLVACGSENSETAWRAVQVLEQVGLEGEVDDLKLVIRGLVSAGSQGHPHLLSRVPKLAARYSEYKSEVAIQKIRSLGGQVNESPYYGVAQAGVRVIGPFDGGRVIMRGPVVVEKAREADARILIEKMLELEVKQAEKPDDEPKEAKPQEPRDSDKDQDIDRNGECGSFEDEENNEQEVQQVEAVVDLDIVPVDADVEEPQEEQPQEIALPDLEAMLLDLESSQVSEVYRSVTIDENWTGGAEGLSYLSQVHNLNYVQLQGIELTPAVFEHISKVKMLNQLSIDQCSFSVADMQQFAADHADVYLRVTGKAMLGVMPTQVASQIQEQSGCELGQVLEDSPAYKAGLKPGDVIVRVDEFKVVDFPTLTYTVAGREVGETVNVKAMRDGKELDLKVTLGPRVEILP